ncbi:hypothetical protein K1T71_003980 [Dendrolimus kikuchii]|uniref:Uncharacterized protein n=1 Tax=Dendrolimus kikuchii TaxID=765133 RepID=A0ACC1D9W6_9NEOP|nr:hypothetical protein K1T71_003980 [Dendrolimus kikuchii]
MDLKLIIFSFLLLMTIFADGKKISIGRSVSSSRGGSRKNNHKPQPAPTSISYPQQSQPKPTLFGWQEKPSRKAETSWQTKPSSSGQSHSYPSSQTGLSGQSPPKPNQDIVPKSGSQSHSYPVSGTGMSGQNQPNNQGVQKIASNSHSYPASPTGMSGQSQPKQPPSYQESMQKNSGYPTQQQGGLSGSATGTNMQSHGSGYPQQGTGYSQYNNGPHNSGGAPSPNSPPGYSPGSYGGSNYGNQYHHPQRPPPPPYNNFGSNYGGPSGNGMYNPSYTPQMPGYFGNYGQNKGFSGVSRTRSALTGVGIAGAGVGTLLTGLALWNLARSTGQHHHTVIYDNRGQPVAVAPANNTDPVVDPMLANLVNCTLTISNGNTTEILAIPCAIASSFSPDASVHDVDNNNNSNDNTKCIVTVVTKSLKEYMTTISCSTLLNTAVENNVTEPPLIAEEMKEINSTVYPPNTSEGHLEPVALNLTDSHSDAKLNCTPIPGEIRDPINPCYSVTHNLEVLPLSTTIKTPVSGTAK